MKKTENKAYIDISDVSFAYASTENANNALNDISMQVAKGDFVAILGMNGSGKSTLAKHINALLFPDQGEVIVSGYNTKTDDVYMIRSHAGMIFQNPDNQIVGTTVEEDVAFGAENLGVPTEELIHRVNESLNAVSLSGKETESPNRLSGGQKQRVAIASVLAMGVECIIFDEATSMLDPQGRKQVLDLAKRLNKEQQITIIMITHYMDEALDADYVYVMNEGQIKLSGSPEEIFEKDDIIAEANLVLPDTTLICQDINQMGGRIEQRSICRVGDVKRMEMIQRAAKNLTKDEKESILQKYKKKTNTKTRKEVHTIAFSNLCFQYKGLNESEEVLKNIDVTLRSDEMVAIVGATGSGKSTFLQVISGLLKPTKGSASYDEQDMLSKKYSSYLHHKRVGIVFQYPEQQLFEETVYKDVAFAPTNYGVIGDELKQTVHSALDLVGIKKEQYELSPLELSGGQMRRVAIAGVLAAEPEFLLLDEPVAGLDPRSKENMFALLNQLHDKGKGIVFISHSMEDVYRYADRVIVFSNGEIVLDGAVEDVFADAKTMQACGLDQPIFVKCLMNEKE